MHKGSCQSMKTSGMWWMLLIQGLLLLALGFFAVLFPGVTFAAFVVGIAAYFVVAGVISLITSLFGIGRLPMWFLQVLLAIVEIGVGVYMLKHLGITAATLVALIGLVFVVRGIVNIVSAFGDGSRGRSRGLSLLAGVLGLIAGVVVWLYPVSSTLAFTWVVGIYGLVAGTMLTVLALETPGRTDTA
jgi:uncharacterized membrane protein HdeD (DUF308 family)